MKDLSDWRNKIDAIDQLLVRLLNERSQCAVEIGHLKKELNMAAWQPGREAEILNKIFTNKIRWSFIVPMYLACYY